MRISDWSSDVCSSDLDWKNTKLFVEYGPGVGTFCRPVLEHLPGDATLIAIDTNEDFIDYLKKDIRDSRFIAVHGSAADVEAIVAAHGFERADYVLSGLPSRPCRRVSGQRSPPRRTACCVPAAPFSSINSAPARATSSPRISAASP